MVLPVSGGSRQILLDSNATTQRKTATAKNVQKGRESLAYMLETFAFKKKCIAT